MDDPAGGARPPQQWREHWFEHDRLLTLECFDDHAAVYFDESVRGRTRWTLPFVSRAWQYVKSAYGDGFGSDGRLYAIFHQGNYSGGHPSVHYDASHDHRNVIDCGPGPWDEGREGVHDMPAHEIAHVVEFANNAAHGSPAFPVWGDSKWAEFFIYDLYNGLGMRRDAARTRSQFSRGSDTFPRGGTHWFRDWFAPLWEEARGPDVMAEYFRLVAAYFPRRHGRRYARNMNLGEYVHFTSGAIGRDLTYQAEIAFGRRDTWIAELAAARRDFPDISYRRRGYSADAVSDTSPRAPKSTAAEPPSRSRSVRIGYASPSIAAVPGRRVLRAQPGSPAGRMIPRRPLVADDARALHGRIRLTGGPPESDGLESTGDGA